MHHDILFSVLQDAGRKISEKVRSIGYSDASRILRTGADGTPTRVIDYECESIFIDSIRASGLPYNIMSEEIGFVDLGGEEVLLVDPLDGTTNALNGIPYFSLSVGIVTSDTRSASAGFVMNLSDGTVYTAIRGKGAFRNGHPLNTRKRSGIFIINYGKRMDSFLEKLISMSKKYRKLGSTALDLCLLASGSVDAVFSIGSGSSPRNFDVGAGILLVEEAGGFVCDKDGNPYNLGLDPSETKDMIGVAERSMAVDFI